jgi:hypothetical protein
MTIPRVHENNQEKRVKECEAEKLELLSLVKLRDATLSNISIIINVYKKDRVLSLDLLTRKWRIAITPNTTKTNHR